MSKFKPGDKVTPVNAYCDNDVMEQFVGKTLLVLSVGNEVVCAGVPGEGDWYWHSDDLRLAYTEEPTDKLRTVNWGCPGYLNPYADTSPTEPTDPAPAASKKPKPIRRGDLVMHRGQIGVVHEIDRDGDYWVAMLTGDGGCVCRGANELTRVGSIRKKVERLKNEMEGVV